MDEETKSLIMALIERLDHKEEEKTSSPVLGGPLSPLGGHNQGLRGMRGLNFPHLNKYLMPDANYFRRLMGFDV